MIFHYFFKTVVVVIANYVLSVARWLATFYNNSYLLLFEFFVTESYSMSIDKRDGKQAEAKHWYQISYPVTIYYSLFYITLPWDAPKLVEKLGTT